MNLFELTHLLQRLCSTPSRTTGLGVIICRNRFHLSYPIATDAVVQLSPIVDRRLKVTAQSIHHCALSMSIFLQLSAILRHHHHHHHYHHHHHHYHHHHLPLNREGRSGTTDHFATSFLHFFFLLFTVLWDLANSNPVYSLMLSSHLFLCLPCLLPPFTVPCKMVFTRPGERNT